MLGCSLPSMTGTVPPRTTAAVWGRHAGERGGHQVHLHQLAFPDAVPVPQRCEDADAGMKAGDDIEHRDSGTEGLGLRRSGEVHHSGQRS